MATLREELVAGRAEAFEAFSEFKKSATYVAPSGAYDPAAGSVTEPAGIAVEGFILPYEQRMVEASGGRIRADDVQYLIASLEAVLGVMRPHAGGQIKGLEGADYSIVNSSDLGSDGIIWELQLRRAGG